MDEEWVARLRNQDKEALAQMIDRYGDDVLRTAILLTGNRHTAEDMVQEAFIKVYSSIAQLREPAKLRSWIMTITMNICRAHMRRASWKQLLLHPSAWASVLDRQHKDAFREDASLRLTLHDCIKQLSYPYREVIILHYYHDLSLEQMSEWTGASIGTLKSRLSRARAKLHELWKEGEEDHATRASFKHR